MILVAGETKPSVHESNEGSVTSLGHSSPSFSLPFSYHGNVMIRLSNERKEAELRVKEDASGEPPSEVANNLDNPFVRSISIVILMQVARHVFMVVENKPGQES